MASLKSKKQDGTVLQRRPVVKISLTMIKDGSLNIRRDLIEEKELMIKKSIEQKIFQIVSNLDSELNQFEFAFSVVSDDGNLISALVAASNDLLQQTFQTKV